MDMEMILIYKAILVFSMMGAMVWSLVDAIIERVKARRNMEAEDNGKKRTKKESKNAGK